MILLHFDHDLYFKYISFHLDNVLNFIFLTKVDETEKKNLMIEFLQNNSKSELAKILKFMVLGDLESINTSYPSHIMELLRNATHNANSTGDEKTLLLSLKSDIAKYKKQQSEVLSQFKDILNRYEKSGGSKDEFLEMIKKLISDHQGVRKSKEELNLTRNNNLVFTGRGTKDALFEKNKETVGGKKVVAEAVDNSKDILKQGKRKMLRANIVLPDATNVNTHIADVIQTPGEIIVNLISDDNNTNNFCIITLDNSTF